MGEATQALEEGSPMPPRHWERGPNARPGKNKIGQPLTWPNI